MTNRYFNSTIERRTKICVKCQKPRFIFSHGMCHNCWKAEHYRNKPIEQPELLPYKLVKQEELNKWYEDRMRESKPVCENCGATANWITRKSNERLFKSAMAHILPKRATAFPSVATHPSNHMVLFAGYTNVCHCHDQWDSSWESAAKMKVFGIAVERFKIFYPFIDKKELRNLPEIFLQELEPR